MWVRSGGARIEVQEWAGAEADPIVLLHEGLGSVGLWRDFPDRLNSQTGRRVIAFSRFGHGASDPPPRQRTPRFFHEEALEVLPDLLAQLGIEDPVLLGHSDGASIALIHAAHHPVTSLVLLAPHTFVEEVTTAAIRATRDTYEEAGADGLRARLGRYHADPDSAFWGWCGVWLDPEFQSWTLRSDLRVLDTPMLLIQSREDPYGSLDQLDRIETESPAAARRLVVVGGHSPHLEEIARVLPAIENFLADTASDSRRRKW
jgi:pimeloyl-ACP methyl ester carboxylesterase